MAESAILPRIPVTPVITTTPDAYRTVVSWHAPIVSASTPVSEQAIIRYAYGDPLTTQSETHVATSLVVDVTPGRQEECIPGSLRLTLGGKTYIDQIGGIYADVEPTTNAGTFSGTLDNSSGRLALTAWTEGATNSPALQALSVHVGSEAVDQVTVRAPSVPVQVGSVQLLAVDVDGNNIVATASGSGAFEGAGVDGKFYYAAGVGRVRFGDWVTAAGNEGEPWYSAGAVVSGQIFKPRLVLASTIRWNCVTTSYLPVDSEVLGIASERLPPNGKVPIFEGGRLVAILHDKPTTVTSPTAGATVDVGREFLSRMWVRDSTGKRLPGDRYTTDLDAGTLTWAAPLDLAGYVGPFKVWDRIMHKCRLSSADISGRLGLRIPLNHDYPAGSLVSSVLWIGDMQARVLRVFEQAAWMAEGGSFWASSPIGSTPVAQYDHVQYPIQVSNRSTHDRYAIIFETDSTFRVISEQRGELARGKSKNEDYTLTNTLTNQPEFTIPAEGWGGGWLPGNVLRFDVAGAKFPWELALTIMEGVHAVDVDALTLEFMGGI